MQNEASKEFFEQLLLNISSFIQNEKLEEAKNLYEEYIKNYIFEIKITNQSLAAEIYYNYAILLFNMHDYEGFLDNLYFAQQNNYNSNIIHNIIIEAFITPNIEEFQKNYQSNILTIKNRYKYLDIPTFKELRYWLLPFFESKFYIYDKENKKLVNKLNLHNDFELLIKEENFDEFSNFCIITEGNLDKVLYASKYISKKNKVGYFVIEDIMLFYSSLQGKKINPKDWESINIFHCIKELTDFIKNKNLIIPRNVINFSKKITYPKAFLDEIHQERLNYPFEKDNVLISICIPTYNRGHRALNTVKKLLEFNYDIEIEIVVSNNGTKNETKYHYDQLKTINDSRLNYFEFKENMGFAVNLCKVCELANGKFILLLSDEDLVNEKILGKILNFISKNNQENSLALLKTSVENYYNLPDIAKNKGKDALEQFMLTSNYISGLLMNRELLYASCALENTLSSLNNSVFYYYPHMYFELLLCEMGNVCSTSLPLIQQGIAEEFDGNDSQHYITYNNVVIPQYATIEGRMSQHKEFFNIIYNLEVSKDNPELFRNLYIRLVSKTLFLCKINIFIYYSKIASLTFCKKEFFKIYNYCISEEFFKGSRLEREFDISVINQLIISSDFAGLIDHDQLIYNID
ncbi:glycosyltransferase [Lysinibacillus sp. NPDC097214]|uniref:glycosyltransferase n=1 Tax=Lysinibacillus sp. NPDC097214 TaxID=3390584 RepID=UPI003CFED709